ncbi:MAG: flavodoxin family protein [Pseudomonadota bacterium]
MAREAAQGANAAAEDDIEIDLVKASMATSDHVLGAAAYLFVGPENLGGLSGAMKEFFDRQYYPVLGRIEGRGYASIIAAGSDGSGAQRQIDRIVTGWRLKRVVEPLIVNFDAQTPEAILAEKSVPSAELAKCWEIGGALGAGVAMGVF